MLNFKKLFRYEEGKLIWISKASLTGPVYVGKIAGGLNTLGYWKISINGKSYSRSRLVFLMFHGYLPKEVDHINGIRDDDRIENCLLYTSPSPRD